MRKIITGIMVAVPLAMSVLLAPVSALETIAKPQVRSSRQVEIAQNQPRNRRPVVRQARHRVWVAGHWDRSGRRRVWVPGRYVWRNYTRRG